MGQGDRFRSVACNVHTIALGLIAPGRTLSLSCQVLTIVSKNADSEMMAPGFTYLNRQQSSPSGCSPQRSAWHAHLISSPLHRAQVLAEGLGGAGVVRVVLGLV